MKLLKKIKSDLDRQIAKDDEEKKQNGNSNKKFSLITFIFDFINGKILIRKGFFKLFKLIFFLWILSIFYIGTRYDYEKLQREQTNLNKRLQRLECQRLLLLEEFTKKSSITAIKQKLEENNSTLSDKGKFIKADD